MTQNSRTWHQPLKGLPPKALPIIVTLSIIVGALLWLMISSWYKDDAVSSPTATVPRGGDPNGSGVTPVPQITPKAGAPKVDVYLGFDCPDCTRIAGGSVDEFGQMAAQGRISLTYHLSATPEKPGLEGANAAYCAADQEFFGPMVAAAIFNQPAPGEAWNNNVFKATAGKSFVRRESLTAFNTCVSAGQYNQYAKTTTQAIAAAGITSFPHVTVNGKSISGQEMQLLINQQGGAFRVMEKYTN